MEVSIVVHENEHLHRKGTVSKMFVMKPNLASRILVARDSHSLAHEAEKQ